MKKVLASADPLLIFCIVLVITAGFFAFLLTQLAKIALDDQDLTLPTTAKPKKIVAVGDISCGPEDLPILSKYLDYCQSDKTFTLASNLKPDAVLALGDLQYNDGSFDKFSNYYDTNWGKLKDITYPAPGNHEYITPGAQGYFDYFNGSQAMGRAGEAGKGYYSFNLASWHFISLNSNCEYINGCDEASDQIKWLEQDLKVNQRTCTLAFWHHPHFTSGHYAESADAKDRSGIFWDKLSKYRADVVLNGHDHLYERFWTQAPNGGPSSEGIRQFTVGTGGKSLYKKQTAWPGSEVLFDNQYGVLEMELYAKAYRWQFQSTSGEMLDSGYQQCVK